MDGKLLKLAIKRYTAPDGAGTAQFFSNGVKLVNPPVVACSRNGDKCMTPIDALQSHNQHVPAFPTKAELDAWVDRIKADVEQAAEAYDGEIIPGTTDPSLN